MCGIGSIQSPWQLLKPTLYMLSFLNPGNIFDNEDKAAFPHEQEFAREITFTNLWKVIKKKPQKTLSSLKNAQHT